MTLPTLANTPSGPRHRVRPDDVPGATPDVGTGHPPRSAGPRRPSRHAAGPPVDGPTVAEPGDLDRIVHAVRRSLPEINGVLIASLDGTSLAHDFPGADPDRVAAMAATAVSLGRRISERAARGGLAETVISGTHGHLIVHAAGDRAVLAVAGPASSNLGLLRVEARSAADAVARFLP